MDYVLPTVPIGHTLTCLSPLQAVSKNALVSIILPGINQPMGIEVTQWVIDHAWRTKPYLSTNKKSDKTALTLPQPRMRNAIRSRHASGADCASYRRGPENENADDDTIWPTWVSLSLSLSQSPSSSKPGRDMEDILSVLGARTIIRLPW